MLRYKSVLGVAESQRSATQPSVKTTPSATLPVPETPEMSFCRTKLKVRTI